MWSDHHISAETTMVKCSNYVKTDMTGIITSPLLKIFCAFS